MQQAQCPILSLGLGMACKIGLQHLFFPLPWTHSEPGPPKFTVPRESARAWPAFAARVLHRPGGVVPAGWGFPQAEEDLRPHFGPPFPAYSSLKVELLQALASRASMGASPCVSPTGRSGWFTNGQRQTRFPPPSGRRLAYWRAGFHAFWLV